MILLAAFLLVAHGRSTVADEPATATPPVPAPRAAAVVPLFDCYRSNSAWGYTLSGRVIDIDGKVWSYGRRGQAWLPQVLEEGGARFYQDADLLEKYTEAHPSGQVEAATLAEKMKLIEAAAAGPLEIEDGGARDAGYSGCHAYVRDAAHHRYRDIDLGSDAGVNDTPVKNTSEAAQQLLAWLRSLNVAS